MHISWFDKEDIPQYLSHLTVPLDGHRTLLACLSVGFSSTDLLENIEGVSKFAIPDGLTV